MMPGAEFGEATVESTFLRLGLSGASGDGKTYTALRVGIWLARLLGGRAVLIDTENKSASKYAKVAEFRTAPYPGGRALYDTGILEAPYTPERYVEKLERAAAAGYCVVICDSITQEWAGPGGILEIVDGLRTGSRNPNDSFTPWAKVTPRHNKFLSTLVNLPTHLIVTLRAKTEHSMEKQGDKTVIRKLGIKPIQRDGIEYEVDVFGDLDESHTIKFTKSRCPELDGRIITRPGGEVAQALYEWLAVAELEDVPREEAAPARSPTSREIAPPASHSAPPAGGIAAKGSGAVAAPSSATERLPSEIEAEGRMKMAELTYGETHNAARPDPYDDAPPGDSAPNISAGEKATYAFDALARRIQPPDASPSPTDPMNAPPDPNLPGFDEALAEWRELQEQAIERDDTTPELQPVDVYGTPEAANRIVTKADDPLLKKYAELAGQARKLLGATAGKAQTTARVGMKAAEIQQLIDILDDKIRQAPRMDAIRDHALDIVTGKVRPDPIDIRSRQEARS